jgi:hypothetical protein
VVAKIDYRCAPPTSFGRRIAESRDKRGATQHTPDSFALHADTAPMNNTECPETEALRFRKILFDDSFHIAGREGVEVENIGNGKPNGIVLVHEYNRPRRKKPGRSLQTGRAVTLKVPAHLTIQLAAC